MLVCSAESEYFELSMVSVFCLTICQCGTARGRLMQHGELRCCDCKSGSRADLCFFSDGSNTVSNGLSCFTIELKSIHLINSQNFKAVSKINLSNSSLAIWFSADVPCLAE